MKNILRKFKFKRKKKEKTGNKKKFRILEISLIVIMIGLISAFIAGVSFFVYIATSAPEFDPNNMQASEASIIFFNDGSEMQRLGTEQRELVSYDKLPQVFIDALLATEDSRFFQHSGIDVGRFAIATLQQLGGNSDAGGASTLTMQVVGHTFTDRLKDEGRLQAILRKFTDVYMAVFQLERRYTKEEIIEYYVNIPYLGCGAWGVEQASLIYFNKTVSELTLVEAATIAGLFQAPDAFDPCRRPDLAEQRRNQVLKLMVRHGYITEENYRLARAISVESMLVYGGEPANDMQGVVDTIVQEVKDRTKLNPYTTSMHIHSTIDPAQQEVINNINNGTLHNWPNDKLQTGIAVIDIETGAISAVGAGRNRVVGGWNQATQNSRHPGSTAKPIFDYGPAIEHLNWSTGQLALDEPHSYSSGQSIRNWDGKFQGLMTIKQALASSRNIPALYTFQQLTQSQINNFVTGLGLKPQYDANYFINEAHSLGAFDGTNAVQMAGAYGAFARGGIYIEPHSFTKIVFTQTDETFRVTPERRTVMSEDTAFLINQINTYAITAGHVQATSVSGSDLAGKTGTSSFDSNIMKDRNYPSSAIRDSWTVVYSPDIVYAVWLGYEAKDEQSGNYLTMTTGGSNRNALSKTLSKELGIPKNSRFRQPSGVVQAEVELETNPIQLASEFTPASLRSTEWFKRGTVPDESTRFSKLTAPTNLTASEMGSTVILSWNRVTTPDFVNRAWLTDYFRIGYTNWAEQYLNKRIAWNESNIGNFGYQVLMQSGGQTKDLGWTSDPTYTYNGIVPSGATFIVKSSYSIFKANQSNGVSITVTGSGNTEEPTTPSEWTAEAAFPTCMSVSDFLNHQSIGSNFAVIDDNGNKTSALNTTLTCTDVNDSSVSCLTLDTNSNYILNVAVRYQNETKNIRYNIRSSC